MAAFSNCAVFETRIFFIMLARCASTVLTLIFSRWPISLFLNPAQINSRISCSRLVRDSGRFLRGGGATSAREARDFNFAGRAMFLVLLLSQINYAYTEARQPLPENCGGVLLEIIEKSSKSCKPMHNGPSVITYSIIARTDSF